MSENKVETPVEAPKTRDYGQYMQKAPSHLHVDFAKYIETKTGFKGVDPKVIQLALALHGEYQGSDERKAAREQEAAEREAAKAAAKTAKKGGPRSPEARELKELKAAAATLEKLKQPVPAATKKRIAELEKAIAEATGESKDEVEVPEQQKADPTATEENLQAEAINA